MCSIETGGAFHAVQLAFGRCPCPIAGAGSPDRTEGRRAASAMACASLQSLFHRFHEPRGQGQEVARKKQDLTPTPRRARSCGAVSGATITL